MMSCPNFMPTCSATSLLMGQQLERVACSELYVPRVREVGPSREPHVRLAVREHSHRFINGCEDDLAAPRVHVACRDAVRLEDRQCLPGGELMALEHRDSNRGLLLLQLFEGADAHRIEDEGLRRPRLAKRGQHAEVVLLAGRPGSLVGHAGQRVLEHGDVRGLGGLIEPFDVGPSAAGDDGHGSARDIGFDVLAERGGGLEVATPRGAGGERDAIGGERDAGGHESGRGNGCEPSAPGGTWLVRFTHHRDPPGVCRPLQVYPARGLSILNAWKAKVPSPLPRGCCCRAGEGRRTASTSTAIEATPILSDKFKIQMETIQNTYTTIHARPKEHS